MRKMVEDKVKIYAEDGQGNKVVLREVSASELLNLFAEMGSKGESELLDTARSFNARIKKNVVPNFPENRNFVVPNFSGGRLKKYERLFGHNQVPKIISIALKKIGRPATSAEVTEEVVKITGLPFKKLYGRISAGLSADNTKSFNCEFSDTGIHLYSLKPEAAPMIRTRGSPFTSMSKEVQASAFKEAQIGEDKRMFDSPRQLFNLINAALSKRGGSVDEIAEAISGITGLPLNDLLRRKVAKSLMNGFYRNSFARTTTASGLWVYSLNTGKQPAVRGRPRIGGKRFFGKGQLNALVKTVLQQRDKAQLASVVSEISFLTKRPAEVIYKSTANTLADGVRRGWLKRERVEGTKHSLYSLIKTAGGSS